MVLDQLRERTKILHEQLEVSSDLMSPALTRERYIELLERFYGFYFPVEQNILESKELAEFGLAIEERQKLPRMLIDFSALGLDASAISRIPICPPHALPPLVSSEDILGCMYVLEGATLGGQIISRHLKERLGMDATSGAAFFESYGHEVGAMWQKFVAFLKGYPKDQNQIEKIVQSAYRTFQSFHDWQKSESKSESI